MKIKLDWKWISMTSGKRIAGLSVMLIGGNVLANMQSIDSLLGDVCIQGQNFFNLALMIDPDWYMKKNRRKP